MRKPHRLLVEPIVRGALLEDLGRGGDLTGEAIFPAGQRATGAIVARKPGTLAGIEAALLAFELLDPRTEVLDALEDGSQFAAGAMLARVACDTRALLAGERSALNVLGHLCGVATLTRTYVEAVAGTKAHIVCTRKTTPGLRVLEKYAVRCGGGENHRFALDDAVLIKDNHIALSGSIHRAVVAVRAEIGHMVKIEVEVDTLDQLREVLAEPVDAVLLDNMSPEMLREAVAVVGGRLVTEASGGVDLARVGEIAKSGVDLISVGRITHSAPSLDIGLDIAS